MSWWNLFKHGPAESIDETQNVVSQEFVTAAGPIQSNVPNGQAVDLAMPPWNAQVVGSGVPNSYPLAINTPLDRAYLRPLQAPLFDTEHYVSGMRGVDFFHRCIGQPSLSGDIKTKADTNMEAAARLLMPFEFSILGFALNIDTEASEADRQAIVAEGLFEFWSGSKIYLSLPLRLFPAYIFDIEKWEKDKVRQIATQGESVKNTVIDKTEEMLALGALLLKQVNASQPYHKFNLGRSALKIKPNEWFGAHILFDKPPQVSKPVKLTPSIVGLKWSPL